MGYKINSKNLSVARLMPRGPKADKRLKYLHTGPSGTTCLTPSYLVRVSLPADQPQPKFPVLYTQDQIDNLNGRCFTSSSDGIGTFDMGDGRPAVNGPAYTVPKIDDSIPDPSDQLATFTCNGEILLKMLKIANEVCDDSQKPLRLRLYGKINPDDPTQVGELRIDTYRQEGAQEFLGVLKGLEYYGDLIPGDKTKTAPVKEEPPKQRTETLKVSTGRRFRS
jgi:hypothetical protein